MSGGPYSIVSCGSGCLTPGLEAQLEAIMFEASGRTFAPGPGREAFGERWLGRYLRGGTDVVLLAMVGETVAGYLVGALQDPAEQERFDDISYFKGEFRDLCRRYPAHLHINLASAFRSQGLGAQLIDVFAARAREGGASGMHVVTGAQARNARFYARCGFSRLAVARWNTSDVAFLCRTLDARS